jgi:hypothetical protein
MNATHAIDKIVHLLGLKFKKEQFFKTVLEDGKTEVTNNQEGELQVGQTLYVVGDSTLTPAPTGSHKTRDGIIVTVDEESIITKLEVLGSEEEVEKEEVDEETQEGLAFTEARDAQGQLLESPTFDVGEKVEVVGPDGEKSPAPDGEHQVVLKDTSGNENKIRIQTVDGVIVQRENVEQMKKYKMEKYPWDECIADQVEKYGDEEIAKKVCGAIKAGNFMEMPGAPDLDIEMAKQELVRSVFSTQVTKEIDDIKQGITEILGVVETLNGKFKTELSDLKSDYQAFKNSPERKPVERKTDFKETFDDFRTEFLKQLRN